MSSPTEFAYAAVAPTIYAYIPTGPNPTSDYMPDGDWDLSEVTLGARDKVSTARLHFNRTRVLRGELSDPIFPYGTRFTVVVEPPGEQPTILFEGYMRSLDYAVSGAPGASAETEDVELHDAVELWADHPDSQCFGQWRMRLTRTDGTPEARLVHEAGLPLVFNPGGRPNRSVARAVETYRKGGTQLFAPPENGFVHRAPVHYFVDPDGADFWVEPASGSEPVRESTRKPRYWTWAQALAYLLWFHAGARTSTPVVRNDVAVYFGSTPFDLPLPGEEDMAWNAVRDTSILLAEPYGETYEQPPPVPPPPPPPFSTLPSALLRAKAALSAEGLNVLEALTALSHSAGIGWLAEAVEVIGQAQPQLGQIKHRVRVWTPGGALVDAGGASGLGPIYTPMLQPYGTRTAGRTASDIFEKNTVQSADVFYDARELVNVPRGARRATLYEVTMRLWPGWRPINDRFRAFIDHVSEATLHNEGGDEKPERKLALSDAMLALFSWNESLGGFVDLLPEPMKSRVKFLARALHAKGDLFHLYSDVLRKWIVPTDVSYPNDLFARNFAVDPNSPQLFRWSDYSPVNFAASASDPLPPNAPGGYLPFILNPISGSAGWPSIRRPLLPCLVADLSGRSIGVVLEVSFDRGQKWHEWNGFRTLPDECGVYLTFDNPYDVANPDPHELSPETRGNLMRAYLSNQLDLRVTATIEGSETVADVKSGAPADIFAPSIPGIVPSMPPTQRFFIRRDRYERHVVLSQFKDRTVPAAGQATNPNPTPPGQSQPPGWSPTNPDDPAGIDKKPLLFRPRDDTPKLIAELRRHQAVMDDAKISSTIEIPWIDIGARCGQVVPYIDEVWTDPQGTPGVISRFTDFRTHGDAPGEILAPNIAGVVFRFAAGGPTTSLILEDWRAMPEKMPQ